MLNQSTFTRRNFLAGAGTVAAAVAAGLVPVGLGPRILRCETAPLAALAVTMALTGNLQ